jgi:hypothetical protein
MAQVAMGHHLMSMQCGLRALGHLSLVFGLLASGALSLAVATDFWLYTIELLIPNSVSNLQLPTVASQPMSTAPSIIAITEENVDEDDSEQDDAVDDASDFSQELPDADTEITAVTVKVHSGLWRTCMYWDETGDETSRGISFLSFFNSCVIACLLSYEGTRVSMRESPAALQYCTKRLGGRRVTGQRSVA